MADEIFMDVAAVKKMAGQFQEMSDKLNQTSKALEMAINMLKASAMIGLAGAAVQAKYLETLKPKIDQFAVRSGSMSEDLVKSAEAYERGDAQGAARFH